MPRRTLSARKARAALMTLRLDTARRQALELRGAYRTRAAAAALRDFLRRPDPKQRGLTRGLNPKFILMSKYKQSCLRCKNLDPSMKTFRPRPAAKTGNIPTRRKADGQSDTAITYEHT